jgi:hypothetical protein
MKLALKLAAVVILTVVAPGLLLAQSNTEIGTWKLNVAQSNYSPGPPPKSETRTYEAHGDTLRMSRDGVAGDGSKIAYTNTTSEDGKDAQISGVGAPNGADTISNTRIDANTVSYTLKKAGKVVQTGSVVVSKDGKFMTITSKGTNTQGQSTNNTTVWDKQ